MRTFMALRLLVELSDRQAVRDCRMLIRGCEQWQGRAVRAVDGGLSVTPLEDIVRRVLILEPS